MPRPKVLPVGKVHEVSQTDSSPKMPRTNIFSEGKSPSASHDESGATTTDPMSELHTIMLKIFEEVSMKFEELGEKLDDMVKEIRNTNQRRAGLQH